MSNLSFYEKALAFRTRYENEVNGDSKCLILGKLISCAFQHQEKLPKQFYFLLASHPTICFNGQLVKDVSEVLKDMGYENVDVSKYSDDETTLVFIKLLS